MKNYLWVIELRNDSGFWLTTDQAFAIKADAVQEMKLWKQDLPSDVVRVIRYVRER